MSKKEEKRLERRKKAVKAMIIPYVFGLAMVILGIWGLAGNSSDLKDYQNSDDVRTVPATVTYAALRDEQTILDNKPVMVWDAQVSFTVDGKEYSGDIFRYTELKAGDEVSIEVYHSKDGTYKIPTVKTETGKGLSNILMYVALGVGAVVIAGATFYLVDERKKNGKKKKPADARNKK